MEFYSELTKLLEKANSLKELENQKIVSQSEKEEKIKKFIGLLKSFLNYKTESEESKYFRIYFINYLSKLIEYSLPFCSTNEKNEIKYLVEKIKDNNNINNSNSDNNLINIINDDIKNKKSENYELLQKNIEDNKNNNLEKNTNTIFALNINDQEPFYPKNFRNKPMKNDFMPSNKNINDIYQQKPNIQQKIINEKENIHLKNDNNKERQYIFNDIKDNINYEDYDNEENEISDDLNPLNKNNIIENKLNNEINSNQNFNYNNINNNLNKINENEEGKKEQINIKNENIGNKGKKSEKKDQNNSDIKIKNNKNIALTPAQKFQKKITLFYDELKTNLPQILINFISKPGSKILNQLCSKIFILVENNRTEHIEQIYKEKLTTIICLLFYFSKNQKKTIGDYLFKSDKQIDKVLFSFLKKCILNPDFILMNNIKKYENSFCKDLYLENDKKGKDLLFSIYTFLIIARCLRNCCEKEQKKDFDQLLSKEYIISFKIQFILRHQEFYNAISKDFIEVFQGLNFINEFFSAILNKSNNKDIIIKYNKDDNDIENYQNNADDKYNEENKYNENNKVIDNNIKKGKKIIFCFDKENQFNIYSLFSKTDNKIYDEAMKKIEHFFSINRYDSNDINDLIYYSTNKIGNYEYNFILNIVEFINEKNNYVYNRNNNDNNQENENNDNKNNLKEYKIVLKNLEQTIYELGKNHLNLQFIENEIEHYIINKEKKRDYNSLEEKIINEKILQKYKGKFHLYPYGSITQFLGGNSSDIDIYLDIKKMKKNEKAAFLYDFNNAIQNIVRYRPKIVISTRLCLFSFNYQSTAFDISLMGLCPYYHSILFRQYSLIDPRFPLLAISLKKFLEIIQLKNNSENKIDYLNSFSWMILLITFLQDIINPPVLPKLLTNQPKKNYIFQYGNNYRRDKFFESFIGNIKEENTFIPNFNYDRVTLEKIYKEQIVKKNNLSCAELFLYFLEFIIYYFKSDSVYANFSAENEGYESIYNILNTSFKNEKNQNPQSNATEERFQEYFKNKYCKIKSYYDNKKTKDGMILIRDPLDPHYNPAHTLRAGNYKTFIDNLKKGYFILLKYGNFYQLKNIFCENEYQK